jgi:lysophospholipase L1-like esterase
VRRSFALRVGVAGALLAPATLVAVPAVAAPLDPAEVCVAAEEAPFTDRGTTHALGIDCLTTYTDGNGDPIARGFGDGTFGTFAPIDRGQFASLLFRFLTVADPGFASVQATSSFDDVAGTTHERAIGALADLGVLTGRSDGTFEPREPVSRGAAASALARALEVAGTGLAERPQHWFGDQGRTHARAIGALADLQVVVGVSERRFATFEPVTRGQAATMLARAAQILHDEGAWAPDPAVARPPEDAADPAPPRATPASTHPPRVVAAIGDSITQASGAARVGEGWTDVLPGGTQPERSWATGTADGLASILQRLEELTGVTIEGVNVARNGARMMDAREQVEWTPPTADLITIQLGANDLCRPDLASMTDPDVFEQRFRAALTVLAEQRPAALMQVASIPDIYRLWEVLRDDPIALVFWNGTSFLPPLVPCQSLLADADSDAPADQQRREAVRAHGRQLNRRLARVCSEAPRCRYDDGALWSFTNDPDRYGADDISHIDHFHPSFQGQRELARVAWESGFDHTRSVPPIVYVEVVADRALVQAFAVPAVAGIEYRWLSARELRPAWTSSATDEVALPLTGSASFLEVRAIDVDGNVSASRIVDPAVSPAGTARADT